MDPALSDVRRRGRGVDNMFAVRMIWNWANARKLRLHTDAASLEAVLSKDSGESSVPARLAGT